MNSALSQLVWTRANHLCEYCHIGQDHDKVGFQIDHVISIKHDGPTIAENLALSCFYCSIFKGTDLSSFDPLTRNLTALFNPRQKIWSRHFQWNGAILEGRTASGRTTIWLLKINDPFRVILRENLIEEGVFPAG